MSSRPLVSSIIIFLNEERFIREAIESVIGQTYDNWELLLVDDGSTDGSTQIALQCGERYPVQVRYLDHPGHRNRGMSASRNLGMRHAKGQYIAFLDADDVWLPHKLQQQVAILGSRPEAAMLYGNTQYWHSWTGIPEDKQRDFLPKIRVRTDTLFEPPRLLTLLFPLGNAPTPSSSNFMLRREAVGRIGGFEESFKGIYEDQAFLAKLCLNESIFVANEHEYWDRYRQHPNSCYATTVASNQLLPAHRKYLGWLEEYLSEQGIEDPEIWKLLREAQLQTHTRSLKARNERLKARNERLKARNERLELLEGALEEERREVRRLRKRSRRLTLRVQNLDHQLQDISRSGKWRLLQGMTSLKAKLLRQ